MSEHQLQNFQAKSAIEIVLISKEQHWRSLAEKLEEERTAEITGLVGKNQRQGKTKNLF